MLGGDLNLQNIIDYLNGTSTVPLYPWTNLQLEQIYNLLGGGGGGGEPLFTAFNDNKLLSDSIGNVRYDWETGILNDSNEDYSINTNTRIAYDSTGARAIDYSYGGRTLFTSGDVESINWETKLMYASASVAAIDYGNYNLIYAGSNTVAWSDFQLNDSSNLASINWSTRDMIDQSFTNSISWENRILYGSSGNPVADYSGSVITDGFFAENIGTNSENLPPIHSGPTLATTAYFGFGNKVLTDELFFTIYDSLGTRLSVPCYLV